MTLRRQFHLLLAAVVLVPVLCAALGPMYTYTHSPEREALEKCYHLKEHSAEPFSEHDWHRLEKQLSHLPPEMESAVIMAGKIGNSGKVASADEADGWTILISTISELPEGSSVPASMLAHAVMQRSEKYFYQLTSLKLKDSGKRLYVLTRASHAEGKRRGIKLWQRIAIPMCVCIAVILFLIIRLSRTIFSSVQVLEEKTRLIADGDLNVTLVDEGGRRRRRRTNEIIELTNNLERMRLSLSDFNERRTRFIMGVSHDLRTPLAVIRGYAEAIADGVASTSEEVSNAVSIISGKTSQLSSMIDALISFVKLDSRDWRQSLVSVPLKDVLEEFAREAVSTGTVFHRNITSRIQISDSITVQLDRQMFTRAMENLLSNAIRYSSDGDAIDISAHTSTNLSAEYKTEVCITISDTGAGIEAAELKQIFDMFHRGTHSRREEGLGIGLAVVKSIVEAHGWTITVQSTPGEGTAFTIHIPI